MATMKKARVLHRKDLKPEDADILCGLYDDQAEARATILQMRRHGNNEEGKGAAQKGFETNQRMQIFYVVYDDQAEARATISSRLDNSH